MSSSFAAGDDDPRRELEYLIAALGAHTERLAATGATGLPPSPNPSPPAVEPAPSSVRSGGSPDRGGAATKAPGFAPHGAPPPAAPPVASPAPPGLPTPGQAEAPPAPGADRSSASPDASAPPMQLSPDEARKRLAVLQDEVAACTRCGLHEGRTQTVFARGNGSSGLCFVGEGPGFDEDKQGLPFVGKAGQLLDRMIDAMGLSREEVYVCNVVKCRPPDNRKPEPDEMAACKPFLQEQLALVQPSVIVALGGTAVEGLLGIRGGITRMRGNWRLYGGRIAVMPTFHPAYLLRNPKAKRDVWADLQEVLRHMGRPIPSKKSSG